MGTWLQEAVEIKSRKYTIREAPFDVNGWRALVKAFVTYVANLDLAGEELEDEGLRALHHIETFGHDLARAARFIKDIKPPSEYLYISNIVEDDISDELCEEMAEALKDDQTE
jgi:hypothetical protein